MDEFNLSRRMHSFQVSRYFDKCSLRKTWPQALRGCLESNVFRAFHRRRQAKDGALVSIISRTKLGISFLSQGIVIAIFGKI